MRGCWRRARAVGLALMTSLAAACGGDDPPGNDLVRYDDGVLVVEGREYRREPSIDDGVFRVLPGRTVVQPREGSEGVALTLATRYGLVLEGRSKEGWLLLKVPAGYEEQWASAFTMARPGLIFATIDSASSPTPIAPAPAADPVAGAPVPAGEPSAEDVRRLFFEQYAQIERAGGLPATLTATGAPLVIHAKLFEARKDACRQLPGAGPGEWECTADLQVALCSGDCDPAREAPLPKSERIRLRWDPAGRWTLE